MRSRIVRRTVLAWTLCSILVGSAVVAKEPKAPDVESQIEFGVKMAKRGLWNEALFRFQQASHLKVDDPKILNNVAVAYEATGRYDEALETYQRALKVAPGNRDLRANYSRFVEFYQSFKPDKSAEDLAAERTAEGGAGDEEAPDAADEPGDG